MLPREQRALLRMERSLRRDPGMASALDALSRRRYRGMDPVRECLSPWHPVLWRAVAAALAASVLALAALAVALFVTVDRPAGSPARTCGLANLAPACAASGGRTAPGTPSGAPAGSARIPGSLAHSLDGSPLRGIGAEPGKTGTSSRHAGISSWSGFRQPAIRQSARGG
jgi:hypothetical protein